MSFKTKNITYMGLCTAIIALATMAIKIPVPATNGYIHMGDSMIFLVSILLGKKRGAICSGVGSALADILLGYAHWAPFTLIIEAIMGYTVGNFSEFNEKHSLITLKSAFGCFIGSIIMVVGYLIGGTLLKGSFLVSLTSVPSNIIQVCGGFIIYIVLGKVMNSKSIIEYFLNILKNIDK